MIIDAYSMPLGNHEPRPGTAEGPALFARLRIGDRAAVVECVTAYGPAIWAMAVKSIRSVQEAEVLTQEIFADIWHHCAKTGDADCHPEFAVVRQIALRCLLKNRWNAANPL